MNLSNFTIQAREAVEMAQQTATELHHPSVENIHLIKSMLSDQDKITVLLLKKLNINIPGLSLAIQNKLKSMPTLSQGDLYYSTEISKTLQNATKLAKEFGDEYVAVDLLFLAIFDTTGESSKILKDFNINRKDLISAINEMRKGSKVNIQSAEKSYDALNRYARNLNELSIHGKLDPVIGRDDEIRRVLQILSRRTKNNPILIGEPGVGKTAIAEGLAQRIVHGDVPENLKNKTIFSLDMSAIIAGAMYKGEFEERLKSVVHEVVSSDGEIVLFIDEIHTLVGAGKGEGAMDAANILKPALARGELRAIGATTLGEYQKYFEKDKALERRFQIVMINEPNRADAISILRGLKERYESHHKVRILDEAVIAAVELSQRYISERFLPDKAIDLIDEAAARLRMQINSLPEDLEKVERKIRQQEIEREAIKRENEPVKLAQISKEIANLTEERNNLHGRWQAEKHLVEEIQQFKKQIEQYKQEAEQAERDGNFGRVAELRYGLIRNAEDGISNSKAKLTELQGDNPIINEKVGAEDIAEVVSRWTGIPITRMLQSEREKLLNLEDELHKRVIGQEEAISAIADAIRRSRAGLQDAHRPVGSFIFLGTTGVGKTELAKALAAFLFNNENALVRVDMSEYQERHSVSRLIGAPPGYVGFEESGQLTEAVRRKPYSVVLLDEIEKAHPDVFNILLQVLDDGRLTDNKGRVVDFKNTIVIMTSNIGSMLIQEQFSNTSESIGDDDFDRTREKVFELLKKQLRPEFLNRIDDIIMFKPLNKEEIEEVVVLQLKQITEVLKQNDIDLKVSHHAIQFIATLGFDPHYGARPIKRVIQRELLNELSKMILAGKIDKNYPIEIDASMNKLVFKN
jgi:ATP-dependent Clp protease ATP-binding subunit ClpB